MMVLLAFYSPKTTLDKSVDLLIDGFKSADKLDSRAEYHNLVS